MDDRSKAERVYFSMPETRWSDVGRDAYEALARVHDAIGLALGELATIYPGVTSDARDDSQVATSYPPMPADLAFQMHETAGDLLSRVAGDEQNLRQIIGTLRTALAVCWDLYSVRESERVTVSEHMQNLKLRIDDFERELRALRNLHGGENGPSAPNGEA